MLSPLGYYTQQRDLYSKQLTALQRQANSTANARLLVVLAAIGLAIYLFSGGIAVLWWGVAVLGITFLLLVRRHMMLNDKQEGVRLCMQVIDNELLALQGNYIAFATGAEFQDTLHPYSYDLDIFGRQSVYQLLCRAVTLGGEKLLAAMLSTPPRSAEVITERQNIVKELSCDPDLLLQFRIAGMKVKEAPKDQARLQEWLSSADEFTNDKFITIAAVVMPALSAIAVLYSFYIGTIFSGLFVVVIINMVLLRRYAHKISTVAQKVGNTAKLAGKYENLLRQLAGREFQQPFLKSASEKAASSLVQIGQLKKLVNLFDSKDNNMVGPLMNMLFLMNLTTVIRMEKWRAKNYALLLEAITMVIQTDVMVSCAVYAFNHPVNIYPSVNIKDNAIIAKGLLHPLLPPAVAVGNDFSLGRQEQFYLLTGANMTGKSTFIRTVGVSTVLFNMGVPLPAAELVMPVVDLYTSMRVTDSVQDDTSYFKAELNRIQSLMGAVKAAGHPYLILLDEPLRGTNSTDKQQGTRAIVDNLLGYNAIGIVATHDTILCDMETNYPGKVSNYHFESKVEPHGLSFDFKLSTGASTSNNATLLMRQMGIITR